jgi:MFS family permease
MRTRQDLKYFVRNLPSNLKIMMLRSSIANFITNVNPYNSLYIIALGATASQLGFLNSIGLALSSILTILTGWIGDKSNKKRIYLIGAFMGLLVPLTYATASSWIWLAPAFILYGLSDGIIYPAWNAMYANSVKNKNRGTIYGLANFFVLTPLLFAGIIGGLIVSNSGGLTINGIKPIYWLQAILSALSIVVVVKCLKIHDNGLEKQGLSLKEMFRDYKEVFTKDGVSSWVLMKSLGSISIGIAGPFWMVYAAMIHNASAMTIAYMVTARSLTKIILSPTSGSLVDTFGRKKMILSGRLIMYLGTFVFLLGGNQLQLILAWILMGINDSTSIAWSAEEAELVPPSQRSRISALSHGAFNALAVPASIIGGYLYDYINPITPFVVMALIDGLIRMPIIHILVPESSTLHHQMEIEEATAFSME